MNSHRSVAESPIDCKERGAPKVEEDPTVHQSSREFIDWTSQKHGPKFLQLSKETQHWIVKLHRNLGHPGAMKLKLYCKQVGCPNNVIEAIDHLKCSNCEESKGPTIARPSAIHSEGDFGDCISMDGITWINSQGERFHFYHFVDHSTAFQTAICSPSQSTVDPMLVHGYNGSEIKPVSLPRFQLGCEIRWLSRVLCLLSKGVLFVSCWGNA